MQVDQSDTDVRRIPILLEIAAAGCTGNESSLAECVGNGLGSSVRACGIADIVSVVCFSEADPGVHLRLTDHVTLSTYSCSVFLQHLWYRNADVEGTLRLADGQAGAAYEYGRLEIFLRGVWSTICDVKSFTPDSANVACRILGFDGGAPLEFRNPTISLSKVQIQT